MASKKPLISIITPTYNHEDFISQCLDSVLHQSYENWEQIVIDDGSRDNTGDLIKSFDDKRLTYIKQDNLGIYNLKKTYNKALNFSRGKYIAILEGDDYWPDYKLEEQIKIFKDPRLILGCGNAQIVDAKNEVEGLVHKSKSFQSFLSTYPLLDELLLRNFIPACTVLCKKEALMAIGGFQQAPNAPYVDYPTWLHLSRLGPFCYEDGVMGYWRRHEGQTSSKNAYEMIKSSADYAIEFFNELSPEEKELLTMNHEHLIKSRDKMLSDFNFNLGMKCLQGKEWAESRKYFRLSLKGSNVVRLYSLIAVICSFLKLDLQAYFK